jgi:hypothetical protein
MGNWFPLAVLTALCLAGYNLFIKLASEHLSLPRGWASAGCYG